ncbi:MAG: hypothetical protein R3F53_17990 [Gammaproteobacteria bacterium]
MTIESEQFARQKVERFVRRFDESYRLLAYYAALPLILTPELLNYLRNHFLRGQVPPWVAEADLLLSDLCEPVGYEQYAMEQSVRACLLADMNSWAKRNCSTSHGCSLPTSNNCCAILQRSANRLLRAERWSAMAYLYPFGKLELSTQKNQLESQTMSSNLGTQNAAIRPTSPAAGDYRASAATGYAGLMEPTICEQFGVSRSIVRQAPIDCRWKAWSKSARSWRVCRQTNPSPIAPNPDEVR